MTTATIQFVDLDHPDLAVLFAKDTDGSMRVYYDMQILANCIAQPLVAGVEGIGGPEELTEVEQAYLLGAKTCISQILENKDVLIMEAAFAAPAAAGADPDQPTLF